MKVVVADKIAPSGVEYLRGQEGIEVVEAYGSTPEELARIMGDASAVIVRSASSITAEIIAAAPLLKAVARAGVGVDNIDIPAATERGIIVMNTPSGNTIATAELAFTHLLSTARPVPQANGSMQAGKWEKKLFGGTELYGKTLAVLGLGRIGTQVAQRAKAFAMRVLAYDPYLTAERAAELDVEKAELPQVWAEADFITVHMPKTEATANMLRAETFAQMKDGVRVINCARGGLINEADLVAALDSGKVAAAGLDVFEAEPLADDSPLRGRPNVVLTPHLGASTAEAQENVGIEAAELIADVLLRGIVNNAVNAPSVDSATLKLLKPYFPLAYRLGTFIQQVTPPEVSKLVITYAGKLAELEVKPLTRAIQRGFLRQIVSDVNDVNAPRALKRLGVEGEVLTKDEAGDYSEYIRIEAHCASGEVLSVTGTLIGKGHEPRLVAFNGRDLETSLQEQFLLVLENDDRPGIVGAVGSILAEHEINISNLALSRRSDEPTFAAYGLDSRPPLEAMEQISIHPAIRQVDLVDLQVS